MPDLTSAGASSISSSWVYSFLGSEFLIFFGASIYSSSCSDEVSLINSFSLVLSDSIELLGVGSLAYYGISCFESCLTSIFNSQGLSRSSTESYKGYSLIVLRPSTLAANEIESYYNSTGSNVRLLVVDPRGSSTDILRRTANGNPANLLRVCPAVESPS